MAERSHSLGKSTSFTGPGAVLTNSIHHLIKTAIPGFGAKDTIAESLHKLLFMTPKPGPLMLSEKIKLLMVTLHRYDKSQENPTNILNLIREKHLRVCCRSDLLFYVLFCRKLIELNSLHHYEGDIVKKFVSECIEKWLRAIANEPENVVKVVNDFVEGGDIQVWFRQDTSTSVFCHLSDGFKDFLSLPWSQGSQEQLYTNPSKFVYSRMLLISLALKFNRELDSSIWDDKLLAYSSEITLDDSVVYNGLSGGLELGSQLALPSEQLFDYHHMTTFIVNSKIIKSFDVVQCYLNTVESYIKDDSQLKELLSALRDKLSKLVIKSSTAAISAMSHEGSLSGAISDSLNLVQYVHNLCAKRGLLSESECIKLCCQWLMIFVRMVYFKDNLETLHLHLGQFLGSEPALLRIKAVHDTVIKYICDATRENLQHLIGLHFESLFSEQELHDEVNSVSTTIITNNSECEQVILSVIQDYIATECDMSSENFVNFIETAAGYLCKDMGWIHADTTFKQKFCLCCVNACCVKVVPTCDSLSRLQPYMISVIIEVGFIYNNYCTKNELTENGHMTLRGQQKLCSHLQKCSEEVKSYFGWVSKVQDVLEELDDQFRDEEVTVHAIMNFAEDKTQLQCLYTSMCVSSSPKVNSKNIQETKEICDTLIKQVGECLLKSIPGQHGFFTLPELLTVHHVVVPQTPQDMVSKHVIFPANDGDSDFQPSASVKLSESISVKALKSLADELQELDDQVAGFTPMLAYFKYHNSVLFRKCLKMQTTKLQVHTDLSNTECEDSRLVMSLDCFTQVLKDTHKLICELCEGQLKYTELINIHPEELVVTKEVEILKKYSTLLELDQEGLTDTLNMLNLCRLSHQVNCILLFCKEFGLETCLGDQRLCKLQQAVMELEDDGIRAKLTPSEALRRVEHMKTLLGLTESTNTQCLDLFTAINHSDAFFQIIKDAKRYPQHKDIATHLQSEISVVGDFSSVIELLSPILDVNQDFESLMANVLKKADDVVRGIQLLENLKRKKSLLIQVLANESLTSKREQKESAIQAKIENAELCKEIEMYKSKLQQMQHDIDDLQKTNIELRRREERLQKQLSSLQTVYEENEKLRLQQKQSFAYELEPWKVSRDKITLGELIGGGGWGAVTKGDLKVAVKQFYPVILDSQKFNLNRLRREMEMLARIRHPNLVQFIAVVFKEDDEKNIVDIHENPPYIITELLDMSLREAYQKDKVSEGNLCLIFQDIARALDYLHGRHEPIVHRDVSSANVLLKRLPNGMWMAKVSDLGSANLAKDAVTKDEGARIYCAPEAVTVNESTHALTPKVDVYSYGIMLCEVITRTLPDENKDKLQRLVKQAECKQPKLHPLIVRCIKEDPNDRPSMEGVLITLKTLSL